MASAMDSAVQGGAVTCENRGVQELNDTPSMQNTDEAKPQCIVPSCSIAPTLTVAAVDQTALVVLLLFSRSMLHHCVGLEVSEDGTCVGSQARRGRGSAGWALLFAGHARICHADVLRS